MKFLRNNALSLTILGFFMFSFTFQILAGWKVYNEERQERHQSQVGLVSYLGTDHFGEATFENWESEFLQMALFVGLTSVLVQKGSAESNSPGKAKPEYPLRPDSPWPARYGGWVRWVYSRSLFLALMSLFLFSFSMHLVKGAGAYSEELGHPVTPWQYLFQARFWFESMQNWQSEFLSVATLSLLSIWLRQENSPESKPVNKPHHLTGA
ncbi:MAG: hypothetical protein KF760_26530 [Candidatus Eremiobacteraeota bacterium]|nr:hypothetical protein [Candidatus Eremiobacteraeota bacterium]MCW5870546.1 hypothetical protein [Candidatus Eremiobacteraeota bacterium]